MVASAQGLDVSNFQGAFDWAAAVKRIPGLAFGICKLTEGTGFTDPDAAHNWAGIAGQGLVRGGYHFGHPGEDAASQASRFVAEAGKLGLTTRDLLVLDLEVSDGKTPAQVASWAQTFMAALAKARPSNRCMVYTMVSFATGGESDGLGRYPLWLARPGGTAPAAPPPWARWTFWQWGTRNGDDADAFNGTRADLLSWAGAAAEPAKSSSKGPPYLQLMDGHTTLAQVAARRSTTPYKLLELAAGHYTDGDMAHLADQVLPAGTRYYTSNP